MKHKLLKLICRIFGHNYDTTKTYVCLFSGEQRCVISCVRCGEHLTEKVYQ